MQFRRAQWLRAQVCLSLLGTWHGTDESQKWHPDSANLWRVLVSIQGMILIGDPYFNEPNVRESHVSPLPLLLEGAVAHAEVALGKLGMLSYLTA